MSVNVYTGLQGSGKSYEVVSSVILDGVAAGRRIVTNIDGINEVLILQHLQDVRGLSPDKLGSILSVRNSDIELPHFFPAEELPVQDAKPAIRILNFKQKVEAAPPGDVKSIVQAGDLVCIDEAWRFYGTDCKITDEAMEFFRMHRHFTHPETGVACDIVLMAQDISDLHRKVKVVTSLSFRMHKAKAVGKDKVYSITMWEGYKQLKKTIVKDWVKTYDPAIFPLYKSYSGTQQGKEIAADGRHNIMDKKLLIKIGLFLLLACFAGYRLFHFFYDRTHPTAAKTETPAQSSPGAPAAPGTPGAITPAVPRSVYSETWRIAGYMVAGGKKYIMLAGANGQIRLDDPLMYVGSGFDEVGTVDGQKVTRFSGVAISEKKGNSK